MTQYEKAVALWQQKNITNDAELAEALHSYSIAFAYHSGKSRTKKSPITIPEKYLSTMA